MTKSIEEPINEEENNHEGFDRGATIGACLGAMVSLGIVAATQTILKPYIDNLSAELLNDARGIYAGVTLSMMPIGLTIGCLLGGRADKRNAENLNRLNNNYSMDFTEK